MTDPLDTNVLSLADALATRRAESRRRSGGPPTSGARDELPVVRVLPGETPRMVTESEAALVARNDHGFYRFGNSVVRITWDNIRVSGDEVDRSLRYSIMSVASLIEKFEDAARYEHWSKMAQAFVPCGCPRQVAESYLARDGDWTVPPLAGVVTAPTLRPDGSILAVPGYDESTGLVFDPCGVEFGAIDPYPSREDAEAALAEIADIFSEYKFVGDVDRAVALSGVLTAVVRSAMPVAPLHAFDAPVAASGKSYIVDVAAVVATGHRAAVMATGGDRFGDAEFEKRLASSVLGGDSIISIDNVEEPLGGVLLCQLLTQYTVKIRPFGKLQNVTVPSTAAYFATGNNLTVIGDLTRRVLVGRIDPGVERPELEVYTFNPVERAARERVSLVRAVLTVVVARIQSGFVNSEPPLGSYGEWSYFVRDSLVWLGEADPLGVMERMRELDPRLARLRSMVVAWSAVYFDADVRTRDVVRDANDRVPGGTFGEGGDYKFPDLRDAVFGVAASNGELSPDRLGWWLRRNVGRTVKHEGRDLRFAKVDEGSQGSQWRLEGAKSVRPDPPIDDEPPF